MRKVIICILLIVFCFFCLTVTSDEKEYIPVFQETDYNYYIYNLDTSESNLTTHNLYKTFHNYTILSISPSINPLYEEFVSIKTYKFDNQKSMQINIDEFEEQYLKLINNKHYYEEYEKLKIKGIPLKQISIYVTQSELDLILSNNNFKLAK